MPRMKSSSKELAHLAGRVLDGYVPNIHEIRSLAASVLSQYEKEKKSRRRQPATPKPAKPAPVNGRRRVKKTK